MHSGSGRAVAALDGIGGIDEQSASGHKDRHVRSVLQNCAGDIIWYPDSAEAAGEHGRDVRFAVFRCGATPSTRMHCGASSSAGHAPRASN